MKLYTTCYIVKTLEPGQLLMQFALTDRENVKAFLLKLKSSKSGLYQDLGVIFETEKKNRSLTQNSSYWMIVGFLTEAIYGDRKEESMGLVHEGLLLAYAPRVNTFKGDVAKRSSALDTVEMNKLIEGAIKELAEVASDEVIQEVNRRLA